MALEKFDSEGNIDPVYGYIEEISKEAVKDLFRTGEIRIDLKGEVGSYYSDDKTICITPTVWVEEEIVYRGTPSKFKLDLRIIEDQVHSDVFIDRSNLDNCTSPCINGHAIGRGIGSIDLRIIPEDSY